MIEKTYQVLALPCWDYIPVISTINLVHLFHKAFNKPPKVDEQNFYRSRYFKQLNEKSVARCVLLLVPVLGNVIVAIIDAFSHRKPKKIEQAPKPVVQPTVSPEPKNLKPESKKPAQSPVASEPKKPVQNFASSEPVVDSSINRTFMTPREAEARFLQFLVAECTWIEEEVKLAIEVLEKSPSKLHKKIAGECYLIGMGVTQDIRKGFEYLKEASLGFPDAQCLLILCYHYGIGTKREASKVSELLTGILGVPPDQVKKDYISTEAIHDPFISLFLYLYFKLGVGLAKDADMAENYLKLLKKTIQSFSSIASYDEIRPFQTMADHYERMAFKDVSPDIKELFASLVDGYRSIAFVYYDQVIENNDKVRNKNDIEKAIAARNLMHKPKKNSLYHSVKASYSLNY